MKTWRKFFFGMFVCCAFAAWTYRGARRKSVNLSLLVAASHNRDDASTTYAKEIEAVLCEGADPNLHTEAYPNGGFASEMRHHFSWDLLNPREFRYHFHNGFYNEDRDGGAPIIWMAAETHDKTLFNALLRHGANPNASYNSFGIKDYGAEDTTLLMLVAYWGDADAMQNLLRHHPHINIRDSNGATPLHHAVYLNRLEAARLLLQAHANPNAWDKYGYTPLMNVAASLHNAIPENAVLDMAKLLLAYHADINQRNKFHKTALTIAREQGHDLLISLLLQHGAHE